MSEEEISSLLFPERAKAGEGYLIPDFKWEEFQMCKHRSSIRLCWRRYCKRAAKQNLMAYSWKCFITLYNAYRKPKIVVLSAWKYKLRSNQNPKRRVAKVTEFRRTQNYR